MTIKGLSLFISTSFISAVSLAQPTLLTELNAGDTWVQTQYTKVSSEFNYDDDFGIDENSDLNLFNFNLITASNINHSFTPVMAFAIDRFSENKESVVIKYASLGGLFSLDNDRQGLLAMTYANSNKKHYIRDSIGAQLAFEMSEIDNPIKNELSFGGTYSKKHSGASGGHSFVLNNKTKLPFSTKLDLVLDLGALFITDSKYSGATNTSYDPSFSYGGELNIHPSKNFSLQFRMENTSIDSTSSDNKVTQTNKLTSVSLIARF